jgi:GWxTD domain-containing protein
MNMLSVSTESLIHVIGWTLLHFFWQGTLIALLLFGVLPLLHERSSQVRYTFACSALVLMVVSPLITCIHLVRAMQSHTSELFGSTLQMPSVNSHGGVLFSESLLDHLTYTLDRSLPLLLFFWCIGVLFIFGRLGLGLIVTHRIRSTASLPLSEELQACFYRLARRMSIGRTVRLASSVIVQVPALIGWFRPVVLIPLGCLSGLSMAQIEAIFAHELAHIRRHDYLISVLQSIVEALLFYHPAVWWVSQTIRKERENCCDDIAVEISGNALIYARALSLLEEHRSSLPAFTPGITGGNLTMRIKRLLGLQKGPALTQPMAFGVLVLLIAVAAASVCTIVRAQSTAPVQSVSSQAQMTNSPSANSNTSPAPTLNSEYQNWLNQDVRWNITPAERAAFLSLGSDPERDHFIEQFWLRRDPAGAPANTYRTEHYRRIAYANQHFTASIPGWETDRGRIYILYGPPFSIDAYPGSDTPHETWYYKSVAGLGENIELKFIDVCSCGNYQLQPVPSLP